MLILAFYSYVGIIAVLLYFENRLLYQATSASDRWYEPPKILAVQDVELTTADGTALHGWWTAPDGWQPVDGAMLYLHGNGGNLSYRADYLAMLRLSLKTAILIVDYPGYGRSAGTASERGCYQAGDAGYDWLTVQQGIPADRVLLYGGSLGGAVATDLAARRPHRALILVSTFTSFPDVAQSRFPWLPARWLVRNQYKSFAKIGSVRGPVFVSHGTEDDLIPIAMGQRLYEAAPGPKRYFAMPGGRHDETLTDDAVRALRRFLGEHGSATSP